MTDNPNETSETIDDDGILESGGPLDLADGQRGRYQYLLYILAIPYWLVVFWGLPLLDSDIVIAGASVVGVLASALAVLALGNGVEERSRVAVVVFSIPFWFLVMWYASTQFMPRGQYGTLFLGWMLTIYAIMQLPLLTEQRKRLELAVLGVATLITAVTTVYIFLNYDSIAITGVGRTTDFELVLAILFTFAISYFTWRAFGVTFLIVLVGGIGYGFAGPYMPGLLNHAGVSLPRMLRILAVGGDGFFGFLNQLMAAWIALFLFYAGLLKAYGAFDLILRIAVRTSKYVDSGIAQTAVVASAVIGSVNGSQTANAGMTGSFTIPLMKENGIKPETAGGIESVASTSGQVLPPVMGAAAFVMASLVTGITYLDVIVAGLIPAVILAVSIVIAVHYVAAPQIEDPDMGDTFDTKLDNTTIVLETIKYGVPLVILMYALGVRQVTVMTAALWTAVSMLVMGLNMPVIQALVDGDPVWEAYNRSAKQTVDGFRQGALVAAPVAIILAAINGVVDVLMATGVPGTISLALIDLSGGVMIIAVVLAMIICILLGLGMPTTAAYTIVALLVAPTLINQFFVPEIAAHFFVFYAAILAGLTPPIATCVAVTCGISGGGFWGSCKEALRISLPLFVLPFSFVYHPELVSGEFTTSNLSTGLIVLIGSVTIIHGINYLFEFGRPIKYGLRIVFFVLGVVMMAHPDQLVQLGAMGVAVALYLGQVMFGRPELGSLVPARPS